MTLSEKGLRCGKLWKEKDYDFFNKLGDDVLIAEGDIVYPEEAVKEFIKEILDIGLLDMQKEKIKEKAGGFLIN